MWNLARWFGLDVLGQWMATIAYLLIPGLIFSVSLSKTFGEVARVRDVDCWRGWGSIAVKPMVLEAMRVHYSQPELHSIRCDAVDLADLRGVRI